jgi:hypothetical protein
MSWPSASDGLDVIATCLRALPPRLAADCTSTCPRVLQHRSHPPSQFPQGRTQHTQHNAARPPIRGHASSCSQEPCQLNSAWCTADIAALAQQTRAQAGVFAQAVAAELDRLDGCVEAHLVEVSRQLDAPPPTVEQRAAGAANELAEQVIGLSRFIGLHHLAIDRLLLEHDNGRAPADHLRDRVKQRLEQSERSFWRQRLRIRPLLDQLSRCDHSLPPLPLPPYHPPDMAGRCINMTNATRLLDPTDRVYAHAGMYAVHEGNGNLQDGSTFSRKTRKYWVPPEAEVNSALQTVSRDEYCTLGAKIDTAYRLSDRAVYDNVLYSTRSWCVWSSICPCITLTSASKRRHGVWLQLRIQRQHPCTSIPQALGCECPLLLLLVLLLAAAAAAAAGTVAADNGPLRACLPVWCTHRFQTRLRRDDGAVALRLRVYADDSLRVVGDAARGKASQKIYVERKTHREGGESVKERFALPVSAVDALLGARCTVLCCAVDRPCSVLLLLLARE